jgi:exodeoxyribonuclease V gamma subunit
MLHIYTSNRLERLIDAFAFVIKSNPLPPLVQETIVVQSQGMERWLSMSLAQQLGVWANGDFPFPNKIVWQLFKDTFFTSKLPDTSKFEPPVMVWTLMDILPMFLDHSDFSELSGYLQEDEHEIKRFQLAWRIANLFDQYVVYRPSWLADWEKGVQPSGLEKEPQASWQAILWRELVARYGTQHRANLRAKFLTQVQHLANNPRFQRVSVFGISALPPFHLEVLAQLGQAVEVHIFLHNPCQQYWADIVSDTEIAHKMAFREVPTAPEALYLEKGNSLLASLGKMGRDFMEMLNDYQHHAHELFETLEETTLLSCIQSDILHLRERGADKPTPIEADDKSIQIHACHSHHREVEVLHDQLLALFEKHSELLPKDVLVMMPDIETYAPFIEAVFATTPDRAKQIPFTIADRNLRSESALIDSFFAILELTNSRFSVSQVLSILETEAVQRRFGLNSSDLDLIRHWIAKTGIRWGMDKADRERMNLPAYQENTWRAGLNRLLLGYALPNKEGQSSRSPKRVATDKQPPFNAQDFLFEDILPYDEIEGNETLALGRLVEFIEQLFECVQALSQPRTLPEWATFLVDVLERFLTPDEGSESEIQQVRQVLKTMVDNGDRAEFHTTVSCEVILAYLHHHLESEPLPMHFLTGKVSFCSMLPMRSIPFKVICLLGMNDIAYPRPSQSLGFDLITKKPRRGDRSRRQNDRYLFLESLLSARQYFYISYVGHSIHDNTMMPPSVVVSELLDYISKGFSYPLSENILDYLITHHPLQAFSPRYFNGREKQLFSYSGEYCTAGSALLNEYQEFKKFFEQALPEPQPVAEWKTVEMNRLTRFFRNPTEFLLTERLGIELQTDSGLLDETEPFEVQGLERYQLTQTLVENGLADIDLQEYQIVAKASGLLPHGSIGDYVYSKLIAQVRPFIERLRPILRQPSIESATVNLTLGDMRLNGHLGHLWRDHLIHYRCAKLKAKDFVTLWIHHLILNSLSDKNLPRHSLLIGQNGSWEFEPVEKNLSMLQTLLTDYYWQGLVLPLSFFPESSLAFVENLRLGKSEEEALSRAQNTWQGSDFWRGEIANEYYHLCFGSDSSRPLLNEAFKDLAKSFFEPLLAHMQPVTA